MSIDGISWVWWAPLVAVLAHIVEEFFYPGGFADWDRSYRPQIRSSITPRFHIVINAALVGLCLSIAAAGAPGGVIHLGGLALGSIVPPRFAAAGWLGLVALLCSNAIWHIVGTVKTGRTSPGVRTGVLLYIPLAAFGLWYFLSKDLVSIEATIVAAAIGGSYQFWADILHWFRSRHAEPRGSG
jgi:hypothetical protein